MDPGVMKALIVDDEPIARRRSKPGPLRTAVERARTLSGKPAEVAAHLDELAGRAATLEANGRRAFQRVGLVRYNPFEDTGGNQSFALALLDAEEDGFIISSLHARTGTRIYAKALAAGRSDGALSDEESEALRVARSATRGRPVTVDRTAPARGPGR